MSVCRRARESKRRGRAKKSVCIAHLSILIKRTEHSVQSSTWTHLFSTMKRYVGARWQMEAPRPAWSSHSGCVCLARGFLSLLSGCFISDIMAASAVPASLRALRCLNRCGAFSPSGARLYCSASKRGSACTPLWAAQAGGNLKKQMQ